MATLSKVKAVLFDLDDTLLDRNAAVDALFLLVLERCYGDVDDNVKSDMLRAFKLYDKKALVKVIKLLCWNHFLLTFQLGRGYRLMPSKTFGMSISQHVSPSKKSYSICFIQ